MKRVLCASVLAVLMVCGMVAGQESGTVETRLRALRSGQLPGPDASAPKKKGGRAPAGKKRTLFDRLNTPSWDVKALAKASYTIVKVQHHPALQMVAWDVTWKSSYLLDPAPTRVSFYDATGELIADADVELKWTDLKPGPNGERCYRIRLLYGPVVDKLKTADSALLR